MPETRLSTGVPGRTSPRAAGLEPENRLALHEQDVVLRQEDLRHLALGAPEGLQERRVVVVRDLLSLRGEHAAARPWSGRHST